MQNDFNMPEQPFNIILSGAGGQLGRSVVAAIGAWPHIRLYAAAHSDWNIAEVGGLERYCTSQRIDVTLPTIVLNAAAYTAVDKAEQEREEAQRINGEAPGLLAADCVRMGFLLLHIGTDYVFDGTASQPLDEEAATHPINHYGRTKILGEEAVRSVMPEGKSLVVRTGWLYSPFGNNFALTMLRLGAERTVLNVVTDQVGTPTYAPHLAECLIRICALAAAEGCFRTRLLHYSDSGVCSWYDMAYTLLHRAGLMPSEGIHPITTAQYPTPAARPAYSVLSKQRLQKLYNIVPPHWSVGLTKLIEQLHEPTERGY